MSDYPNISELVANAIRKYRLKQHDLITSDEKNEFNLWYEKALSEYSEANPITLEPENGDVFDLGPEGILPEGLHRGGRIVDPVTGTLLTGKIKTIPYEDPDNIKLPVIFYHGTPSKNLDSISQRGLIAGRQEGFTRGIKSPGRRGIYLFDDYEEALMMIGMLTTIPYAEEWALLKVDLPKGCRVGRDIEFIEEQGAWVAFCHIPPCNIKFVEMVGLHSTIRRGSTRHSYPMSDV